MRTFALLLFCVSCCAAALLAAPPACAQDSPPAPPPPPAWGQPTDTPTSIAWPAGGTSPGASTPTPRFVRRTAGPYDITSGPYRPRGPVEVRDEWLLAQPKMTLPAVSPDPVPQGQWRVHFYINRGNDFGFDQTGPAEMPIDRRFLVDGEHQTTAIDVRWGARPNLAFGVRLPVHWRGGGFMDSIIDKFHDATKGIGFLDNARPAFDKDRYRVEGRDAAFNPISWNDKRGTGLGNLQLEAYWNVVRPCRRCDWRASIITRVGLPTGSNPYDSGGVDVGLQAVVGKQILRRWDVYAGVGGTWFSDTELDGIIYEDLRGHGFAAAEWHVGRNISLVGEVDAATRLVTNLAEYPALSSYVNLSMRWDVSRCFETELGFTENIENQQGTIDIGVFGGFTWRR